MYLHMYIIYINKLVNILLNELRKLHFHCLQVENVLIVVLSFHLGFRTILGHD